MHPLVLDTCATIWISQEAQLSPAAVQALDAAHAAGVTTYISPITAWEVGMLVSRGRLRFLMTPQRWFAGLIDTRNVVLADLSPDLLIASSFLPGKPPRDPTDRIIAATAREYGATLITRDRALLDYGGQGHVRTLAC